jgi:hypothetical protein
MSFGAKFVVHLIDLYGLLAFWTNRDAERMDRLFRRSALMRQKWGEREDYRRLTIGKVIAVCKSGYTPRPETIPEVGEAIRKLKAFAERDPWTGKGGPTDWKAFGFLLNTGGIWPDASRGNRGIRRATRYRAGHRTGPEHREAEPGAPGGGAADKDSG